MEGRGADRGPRPHDGVSPRGSREPHQACSRRMRPRDGERVFKPHSVRTERGSGHLPARLRRRHRTHRERRRRPGLPSRALRALRPRCVHVCERRGNHLRTLRQDAPHAFPRSVHRGLQAHEHLAGRPRVLRPKGRAAARRRAENGSRPEHERRGRRVPHRARRRRPCEKLAQHLPLSRRA